MAEAEKETEVLADIDDMIEATKIVSWVFVLGFMGLRQCVSKVGVL